MSVVADYKGRQYGQERFLARCPSCGKRIALGRTAEDAKRPETIQFRCRTCGEVFEISRPAAEPQAVDAEGALSRAELDMLESAIAIRLRRYLDDKRIPDARKLEFAGTLAAILGRDRCI